MTLLDDVTLALPNLRAEAELLMVDACTITRTSTGDVFDPDTGTYTASAGTAVYAGKCKIQYRSASTADVGEQQLTLHSLEVHVPMSVTDVTVDDVVAITAAVHDASLVGRTFRVIDDFAKTYATARRLRCEEVTQ